MCRFLSTPNETRRACVVSARLFEYCAVPCSSRKEDVRTRAWTHE
eukprot:IDg4451t1